MHRTDLLAGITGISVLFFAWRIFYRLYLHPLAKVPGPKLAAASRLYEGYWDCLRGHTFVFRLQEWHKQYGPIVRIGPDEVHIDDPDWYSVLHGSKTKLDKDPWYYGFMGHNDAAFTTEEHDVHRMRRKQQDPFFSRANVDRSAADLGRIVQRLMDRFETFRQSGEPLAVRNAFKSIATDAVCNFCFPSGTDFVSGPEFSKTFHDGQFNFSQVFPWLRHFPGFARLLFSIPDSVVAYMDEESKAAFDFTRFLENQARESIRQSVEKESARKKTIIREMFESDMPPQFRTSRVLENEAVVLVAAGIATVSRTLEGGLFHILSDSAVTERLTKELRAYKPDQKGMLTHHELENLPYLTAVIIECQRRLPATFARFARINKTEDMQYQEHLIPKGTVISMGVGDVLLSEKVWENPTEFDPSRWLDPEYKKAMHKYMNPFSRGSRSCVGQNLATAQLYLVLGNFFRTFDAKLYKTDAQQIEVVQDCFNALCHRDTVGVRVLLTSKAKIGG